MPKKKATRKPAKPAALALETKNGWLAQGKGQTRRIGELGDAYREFLSQVKTEREACRWIEAEARRHGYVSLSEAAAAGQPLRPGAKVFSSLHGKSIVLAHVGYDPLPAGLRIVGAHLDSPRLDLKSRPLYEDGGLAFLDTHYYGGIKKYQWVALPLALHGVVARKNGDVVDLVLGEDPADPVLVISDLLPHLGKDQAEKKLGEAITGEGLNILAGSRPAAAKDAKNPVKLQVLQWLQDKYGLDEADLTCAEIQIVPAGPARDLGFDRSMILGYGHDDRVCAYTALRALLDLEQTPRRTAVCLLCDKEEIGSYGATGMLGQFFENAVAELLHLAGTPEPHLALRRCLRQSQALSADVNAVHDPNYPEVSSPNDNMAKLNHGLILSRYFGSRGKSGASEARAEFAATVRQVMDAAGVLWQVGELGKVDQGGGGTISYMLARYEMDVLDCGVGLLSMHAPWEIAGKLDLYMACRGYGAFYVS